MKTFRLLYLRHSLLEQVQEVQADNVVEAMGQAFGQPPDVTVEIWTDVGRVGIIGSHEGHYRQPKPRAMDGDLKIRPSSRGGDHS